jgi:hypothetical protein
VTPNESSISEATAQASTASAIPPSATLASPSAADSWASRFRGIFIRHLLVVGVLGAMVMIGLFLSNYSSEKALYYWCAMFPLFGVASIAHEFTRPRTTNIAFWPILLRQVLHWIGPVIAVKILFMQHARGQMSTDAVALTTVLVLAVTCFLAGIDFEPSFLWVSALLVLAALIGTEIETYLWLVVLLFVTGIVLAAISVILLRRARKAGVMTTPVS